MERKKKTAPLEQEFIPEPVVYQNADNPNQSKPRDLMHYIIVGLLVISAFFVGSLSAKVQYLEKKPSVAQPSNAQAGNQAPAAEPTVGDFPKISNRDHVRGDKTARLALIEYSDYECPFCKQFHPSMQQIMTDYQGKVQWIYRHYPLDFHQNAQKEAEAAECVYELGGNDAFWKYSDALYDRTTSNGTGFALEKLGPLAAEIGLSQSAFQTCLDGGKYTQYVKDDRDGGMKAGIQGTPGTIILDTKTGKTKLIPGALPYASIKPMLDEMLK